MIIYGIIISIIFLALLKSSENILKRIKSIHYRTDSKEIKHNALTSIIFFAFARYSSSFINYIILELQN